MAPAIDSSIDTANMRKRKRDEDNAREIVTDPNVGSRWKARVSPDNPYGLRSDVLAQIKLLPPEEQERRIQKVLMNRRRGPGDE